MASPRVIKKYPNRRLYDTHISRYITLQEIRTLVLEKQAFQVIDKQSGDDITRSILLQVIAEQEEGGNPIFTTDMLTTIIRFYGDSMQASMSSYMELSLQFFEEQQQFFKDRLQKLLNDSNPLVALREISNTQLPLWKTVRKEFLSGLGNLNPKTARDTVKERITRSKKNA